MRLATAAALKLCAQPLLLGEVASREVERHRDLHTGRSRYRAGLCSSEMCLACGVFAILIEKDGFDECDVRLTQKRDQRVPVVLMAGDIRHVAQALSWYRLGSREISPMSNSSARLANLRST